MTQMINDQDILKQLEKNMMDFSSDPKVLNVGTIARNTDGVVTISGLSQVGVGEQVAFADGTLGVVLGLDEDDASVILLGNGDKIREGDTAKRTGKILSIMWMKVCSAGLSVLSVFHLMVKLLLIKAKLCRLRKLRLVSLIVNQ